MLSRIDCLDAPKVSEESDVGRSKFSGIFGASIIGATGLLICLGMLGVDLVCLNEGFFMTMLLRRDANPSGSSTTFSNGAFIEGSRIGSGVVARISTGGGESRLCGDGGLPREVCMTGEVEAR